VRVGCCASIAALLILLASNSLQNATAEGDTRSISLRHTHTNETLTITYKVNGRYDEAALKKLNNILRDWREDQPISMDPHLLDLIWDVYREVGATEPIQIVCGYRSPGTNAMLHARSSGVAQFSQHTLGHAMDFFIPGVPLESVRAVGLQLQRGGVGFYPTSGSPFVHMDTGTVRHWPSIPREQMVRIFPDGRTVHVPADGHPLPGYRLALAEVEKHGNAPNARSLEAARAAGLISDHDEHTASIVAQQRWQQVDLADASDDKPPPAHKQARMALASLAAKPVETKRIVPLPTARPKPVEVAAAAPKPEQRPALPSPFEVASALPVTTGADRTAMAYADEPVAPPVRTVPARAKPMGTRVAAHAPLLSSGPAFDAPANFTVAAKGEVKADPAPAPARGEAVLLTAGLESGNPWMRAVMLTPNVAQFLTMTRVGPSDPRWMAELMQKPAQALAMAFSADPQGGLVTHQFTGDAVVFLATATFTSTKTASLR
jgi:uncharacterized protein YcbK (DUF882 family)